MRTILDAIDAVIRPTPAALHVGGFGPAPSSSLPERRVSTCNWGTGRCGSAASAPVQSASRSLMARIGPPEFQAQMFGLYAVSGKAIAFVGPALVGWVTVLLDSQRAGMATVFVLLVAGLAVLWPLPAPEEMRAAQAAGDVSVRRR
ncbi:MAG: MFS transporter [Candidatus Rokuibacteriota bacterium]